jgi:beta-glucanase (GH16 family)
MATINPETWTFDFGDGCERGICGWGNQELEYYTSRTENARVENGNLLIEARREDFPGKPFTSARLKTYGRVQFKYGTLEARIKVPNLANGLWPAFWMLGTTGNWPASGEIDIMEMGSGGAIQANLANKRVGTAVHWESGNAQADYNRDYVW